MDIKRGGVKAPYEAAPSAFDTIDAERWAQNHCPPGGPAQSPRKRGQGFLQDHEDESLVSFEVPIWNVL